ncbi:MAG TPA: helix-turn-helix transcriptional regulator [Elusimicrobiales bacterium]|nr:helix-turn-helix transcriptional regulator [Elusimicrobiales bacterium]
MNNENKTVSAKQVGAKIKLLRTANGLTQVQVAKKAKMSVSYFGLIERGKASSTVLTLFRISKALRVEVYKLFIKG